MKRTYIVMALAFLLSAACGAPMKERIDDKSAAISGLRDSIEAVAAEYPGEIGVAVITDAGDTITVGNETKYPLMSVFKLHQAIALCHDFEERGVPTDTVVTIARTELNENTWSPMLKDFTGDEITVSVRDLLRYSLMQSDNNASNYLFEKMVPVAVTDSFIATLIPRESFSIRHTEDEMFGRHALCYENRTSPLGAALLIERLFTDSIIGRDNGAFIRRTLGECLTGTDRIVAPLIGKEGVAAAHKTGSGFRDAGILAAHNDVAFITLPGGRHYVLAVFVKDFRGTEAEAAAAIARISEMVYKFISTDKRHLAQSPFWQAR